MCLRLAIDRPDDVLSRGEHNGIQWIVMHNGLGYRCGYARVPAGHPWHGKDHAELQEVEVHGGLSFSDPDVDCGKEAVPGGWWLGFDAAHGGDAQDTTLCPFVPDLWFQTPYFDDVIRTTKFMEAECRSLCDQIVAAAKDTGEVVR